jgi:hypothetical protein
MLPFIGKWIGENLLFSSVLESDDRVPCVTFIMPRSIVAMLHILKEGDDVEESLRFGLLLPRIEFWIALVSVSQCQ